MVVDGNNIRSITQAPSAQFEGQMKGTLTPYIGRYVTERRRRGEIQANTARDTRLILTTLATSFGERPLSRYGRHSIEKWMESQGHLAPATRARRFSVVHCFSEWLFTHGHVKNLATLGVKPPQRKRRITRDIGDEEYWLLMDAAHTPRARLVVSLQYSLGLRCVEVSRLNVDDWHPGRRTLRVVGKGQKERIASVPENIATMIDDWLRSEHLSGGPIIRSVRDPNQGLAPTSVSGLVRRVFIEAGIKRRPFDGRSAHALRAGAATGIYETANDLRFAQMFLDHANVATTSYYLNVVENPALRDFVERRWARVVAAEAQIVAPLDVHTDQETERGIA